jgi:hypothetical protein
MACASYISALSLNREVEAMQKLSSSELILLIGGLPPGKEKSAELAVEALQDALGCALGAVTR